MARIFSGMKPLPCFCLLLLADTQGTSGGISSRSVLLPLGSFRLAVVFCHFSARVSPQISFIPSIDYRNIPVFQYSARTLLSHVPFSWVAKKKPLHAQVYSPSCSTEVSPFLGHAFSLSESRAAAFPAG